MSPPSPTVAAAQRHHAGPAHAGTAAKGRLCDDASMPSVVLHSVQTVVGWGYEGRSVDDLIHDARVWQLGAVVDVRLNAISRRVGFSKRALGARLEGAGMAYLHLPALGNHRDNRAGFGAPGTAAARAAHLRYTADVLESEAGREALREVLDVGPAILLCFEAQERTCHRSLVRQAIGELQASEQPR